MHQYHKRAVALLIALVVGICLAICTAHASSLAQVSEDASSRIFLPLVFTSSATSTPTCTPTPAATRTPTPTATPTATPAETPCPVDDVSGSYDVQYSNVQHNCPFPIPDPSPDNINIEIIQNETDLTLRSGAGDATGTIDPQTGDFQVVATSTSPPCTFGCVNATTGTFRLGQNPMTFTGTGQIDVLTIGGGVFCTVTYDVEGTRTSCAGAAITSSSTAIVTTSCRPLPGT